MPPVHRRSRLLTRAELVDDLIERAQDDLPEEGSAEGSEEFRPACDNDTLLRKAAGGPAAEEVRRGMFRG